ncbi:class I SAM-dependent rRNA methyltransferase [Bacillus sp. MUM 13]|uniref:class I SAM-dependent rRNA methyltransferase n=1 Tax=Bacillus sp. MUM 13 TaxID=1678001 RepID=UPI0008F58289|nr:class I SAM-dependent rRNA methyltransferase [Bacillus sp. MUM 13]OIK09445.1 50S rRNA methyltransferase [Bacillus sp. MUM 13]
MKTEIVLQVKQENVHKFQKGYPLITKDAVVNIGDLKEEGCAVKLVDRGGNFLAKGYYGKQNKGIGWILTRNKNDIFNQAFFDKKLKTAVTHRKSLFNDEGTTAFRVFNGEGDGIGGVTIDHYDGHYVISWYSQGIYQYKDLIIKSLCNTAEVKSIYQKKRFDAKGQYMDEDDFVMGEVPEFPLIVKENGVRFAVYLNDGAMVGVFLDQREVRKTIRDKYASGKKVLNTFSYTGAFSVFAALGGAEKTTSVDLANRSLPKTTEQFQVNGIDSAEQDIIVMDVFNYFKYAAKKEIKYDMVILDPPSFAKSKKFTFSAGKDYKNLLKDAISITEKDGMIVASTNSSSFDMKRFKGFIAAAFKETGGAYRLMEEFSLPEDFKTIPEFKEGNYLKVVFIKKVN